MYGLYAPFEISAYAVYGLYKPSRIHCTHCVRNVRIIQNSPITLCSDLHTFHIYTVYNVDKLYVTLKTPAYTIYEFYIPSKMRTLYRDFKTPPEYTAHTMYGLYAFSKRQSVHSVRIVNTPRDYCFHCVGNKGTF